MDRHCWLAVVLLAALLLLAALESPGVRAEPDDAIPTRIVLADTPQLRSVVGRRMLRHLLECALEPGVVATAEVAGESFFFPGSLGLAPAWLEGGAGESEQRWVSACMLARMNYFGLRVALSMRVEGRGPASLMPGAEERADFTLHEGGFFGNLFAPMPVAFVCEGARSAREQEDPGFRKRVCSLPAEEPELAKQGLSRCGFHRVGPCGQRTRFEYAGESYGEVIHVYLKPAGAD